MLLTMSIYSVININWMITQRNMSTIDFINISTIANRNQHNSIISISRLHHLKLYALNLLPLDRYIIIPSIKNNI